MIQTMEHKYNAMLGLFIIIVIGAVGGTYVSYFQNLPEYKKIKTTTNIQSSLNHRADSIYHASTSATLENFLKVFH